MLDGKKLLITGVVTRDSIAYHVAERAQRSGAEVVLTGFGRARRLTERAARTLPEPADVLARRWGRVDGVLHAIAFAPGDALGGDFLATPADSAVEAFRTSAYSLKG